ncbi:MAG: succinate dehydrogenase assembly factor 2 [Gammaproteobacteria bacterium]|nr:succinate dehydrogenase assembly factor 2 [Gammaproteobacteria bacterium]
MKRLHWKCRRGMKEMDILFEHYLYQHFEEADVAHQAAFEEMCAMQDPVIADYLFERSYPESDAVNDIIIIMRSFSTNRH